MFFPVFSITFFFFAFEKGYIFSKFAEQKLDKFDLKKVCNLYKILSM